MALKIALSAASLLYSSATFATTCSGAADIADRDGTHIIPRATSTVIGAGRLRFYSAPLPECAGNTFIVPNDRVTAYQQYRGWTYVMYLHPVTGVDTSGWVPSTRLLLVGSVGVDEAGP